MTAPSTERLRELAAEADSTIMLMEKDRDHFLRDGLGSAAGHYADVIQKQADIAVALRAVIAVRELMQIWQSTAHALRQQNDSLLLGDADKAAAIFAGCADEVRVILGAPGEAAIAHGEDKKDAN